MKTKMYLLLLFTAIISSCSNDSSDESEQNNPSNEDNFKYLKSITYTEVSQGQSDSYKLDFYYENELLTKINNEGWLVYFEYNEQKKIKLDKGCIDMGGNLPNIDISTYNCTSFGEIYYYSYKDGRLNRLEYDSKGNVVADILNCSLCESIYYTYDTNGNVISRRVTDGSSSFTDTYELDNQKNPLNVLWMKYGLDDRRFGSFPPYNSLPIYSKRNAKKVFHNNKLEMEASYTYNNSGYPILCNYTEYTSSGSILRQGTVTYTYY